jgi:RecA-family ATPase
LDKFDILTGGKVLYFSAEEPEDELHNRVKSICAAISTETETPFETLWPLCVKNLFVVNFWGSAKQLFDVKANSLEPSGDYWQIYNTLRGGDFKLCVFDTRSRLSGAEGSGNALVSREVSFYEKLAADFGCTVLILHHTNKTSYSGEGNAAAAQRGESSFLDCLRLGIHLQTISEDVAAANGIPSEDRFKYLAVTQAKSNYTVLSEPIIIERDGWHYSLTDLRLKTTTGERKAKQEQADIDQVVEVIKDNAATTQRGVICKLAGVMSLHRVRDALKNALDLGRIVETSGARAAKCYNISTETT